MSESMDFASVCYDVTTCEHCARQIDIQDRVHVVIGADGNRLMYHTECYLFAVLEDESC